MTNSIYWLILIAVLILIEILTLGLTTIWFACGALVTFIVSLFVDNLFFEMILFLLISIAQFCFIRPLIISYLNPKRLYTNYEEVLGKKAFVTTAIDNKKVLGQVSLDGQEWSAKSLEGNLIEKGSLVKILGISGMKLVVNKVDNERS